MPTILKQRDIIDRRALGEELAQAIGAVPAAGLDRAVLLPALKAALGRGREEIQRRFEAGGTAARCVAEQCFLVDQLVRVLYDFATETVYPLGSPTSGEKLAIVAVGGYGRGELAPYSDIDLLFLTEKDIHADSQPVGIQSLVAGPRLQVGRERGGAGAGDRPRSREPVEGSAVR